MAMISLSADNRPKTTRTPQRIPIGKAYIAAGGTKYKINFTEDSTGNCPARIKLKRSFSTFAVMTTNVKNPTPARQAKKTSLKI